MVQPLGHVAVGLLFALPAWLVWDGRTAAAFVAFVLATSPLPDVDLLLQGAGLPVKHHGVTHTVVFALGVAAVVGIAGTRLFEPLLRRWWRLTENERVNRGTLYVFVGGGLALGGLSHLLADALASDWAEPIEPFWPVLEASFELGLFAYDVFWANLGLLLVAVALHLLLIASNVFPMTTRYDEWTMDRSDGKEEA